MDTSPDIHTGIASRVIWMNRAPRQISEPTERMVNPIKKNIAEKIAIGTNSKAVEIRLNILINILYLYIKYYFIQAWSHNPVK
jgi:hypothetical protein